MVLGPINHKHQAGEHAPVVTGVLHVSPCTHLERYGDDYNKNNRAQDDGVEVGDLMVARDHSMARRWL